MPPPALGLCLSELDRAPARLSAHARVDGRRRLSAARRAAAAPEGRRVRRARMGWLPGMEARSVRDDAALPDRGVSPHIRVPRKVVRRRRKRVKRPRASIALPIMCVGRMRRRLGKMAAGRRIVDGGGAPKEVRRWGPIARGGPGPPARPPLPRRSIPGWRAPSTPGGPRMVDRDCVSARRRADAPAGPPWAAHPSMTQSAWRHDANVKACSSRPLTPRSF